MKELLIYIMLLGLFGCGAESTTYEYSEYSSSEVLGEDCDLVTTIVPIIAGKVLVMVPQTHEVCKKKKGDE